MADVTEWLGARRVTRWDLSARTVAGGYRIAWKRWVRRGDDGWDEDFEWVGSMVYPTREACEAAIGKLATFLRVPF
jgi:hypothetical protein